MNTWTQEIEGSLSVDEVTVLEDRALVVRRGQLLLRPGKSRLRIEGVAPVIADKSLIAEIESQTPTRGQEASVLSLHVERRRIIGDEAMPSNLATLHAQLRDVRAQLEAVGHEERLIAAELAGLASLETHSLEEIAQDVAWGRSEPEMWSRTLDAVALRRRALDDARCDRLAALGKLNRDLEDLESAIAARVPEPLDTAALVIEFFNPEDVPREIRAYVNYVVPGVAWRPWHVASLVDGVASVDMQTEACVWQSTGEDWSQVHLAFSTQRPSLGASPPDLQSDILSVQRRGAHVHVEARDQAIQTAGGGIAESQGVYDELPGVDDGGRALDFRTPERVSVPSDGRPHRFPLFGFTAPADVDLVCRPELQAVVFMRSRQSHSGSSPILAGPVDLIRNSGIVGRTMLPFVAPGERFELGWGPQGELRVTRKVTTLAQERRSFGAWTRRPRRIEVRLSNLGPEPRTVEIVERIPISEIEKVQVEPGEAEPTATADADGFFRWAVRVRAFGQKTVSLSWTLLVHDDVVGPLP